MQPTLRKSCIRRDRRPVPRRYGGRLRAFGAAARRPGNPFLRIVGCCGDRNTRPPALATSGAGYKDGTYSADGTYKSPNGTETVGVQLTLANGTVSAVEITEHPSNPNTRKFQGQFAGGIAAQVVGKSLDEIKVSKVAGSSLTSGGFNQAVEEIKSQAV